MVLNILFKNKFKTSFKYLILTLFFGKILFWSLNFIKCLFFFPKLLEKVTFSFLFLSLQSKLLKKKKKKLLINFEDQNNILPFFGLILFLYCLHDKLEFYNNNNNNNDDDDDDDDMLESGERKN